MSANCFFTVIAPVDFPAFDLLEDLRNLTPTVMEESMYVAILMKANKP
jgi:hypothetical protein